MDSHKKTLGIITFNRALNYGAILQAYALKAVCEEEYIETVWGIGFKLAR